MGAGTRERRRTLQKEPERWSGRDRWEGGVYNVRDRMRKLL